MNALSPRLFRPLFLVLAALPAAALAGACSSGSNSNAADAGTGELGSNDAASPSDVLVSCNHDSRIQQYAPNAAPKRPAASFQVKLESIAPAPLAQGKNSWTLDVADAHGAPAGNATLDMKLYMPDHGHYSTYEPPAANLGNGKWRFDGMYIFMPGVWEITILISTPGDTPDAGAKTEAAEYFFCVDG